MSSETCVWLTQPVCPDHGLRLLLSNLKGHAMSLYCCLTSALSVILLPNLSFRLRSIPENCPKDSSNECHITWKSTEIGRHKV